MRKKIDAFLSQLSNLAGIDLHYFAKGSFWFTANQALYGITGFILSLLYSRFIPKLIFGQYSYILSFVAFFSGLALPGMNTTVVRAVAQGRDRIFESASQKTLPWAILASLPLVIIAGYYFLKPTHDPLLSLALLICALLTIPLWSFRFYDSFLIGKTKFKSLFTVLSLLKIINLAFMSLVIIFSSNLIPLLITSLAVEATFNVGVSLYLYKEMKGKKAEKADFDFAKQLNDIRIFNNFSVFADKIIIAKLLGFEAVAIYTFAQLFPEQIKSFLKNFYILSLPKLSQINIREKKEKLLTKLFQFFVLSLGLTLLYIILSPVFFRIFFPQYLESVRYSQVLSLSLISLPGLIITALFESQANTKKLRWQIYPSYSLQLLLLVILTLNFGLWGTVFAIVLARISYLILSVLLLHFVTTSEPPK